MNAIYELLGIPIGWIMWAIYQVIPIYGLALLILTILTKAVLLPTSIKQHKNMVKQRIWQPKISEIQKKYKNDRERQQQELARLQEEEGMKMSMGCSGMLIQFLILFGLIDVVYKPMTHILHLSTDVINKAAEICNNLGIAINTADMSFQIPLMKTISEHPDKFSDLGAETVQKITSVNFNFLGLDLTARPEWLVWNIMLIIPVLMAVSMLLQTYISNKLNPAMNSGQPGMGGMKYFMYIMSAVFVLFSFSVPAGVSIYWIMSNILAIIQTIYINKKYPPARLQQQYLDEIEERKKARRAEKKAKKMVKRVTKTIDGKKVEQLEELSMREVDKIRLAKARALDAQKYGDETAPPSETNEKK